MQKELNVVDICTAFGLYIRFIVSLDEPKTSAEDISRNAFAIMMQDQRYICAQAPSLPDAVVERTKKDKLFNDLLRVVEQKGLKLSSGELESCRSYLIAVTSALSTRSCCGCDIPELFQPFKGYNSPQLSKHRKREHMNLNADKVATHAASLYDHLLLAWLNTPEWLCFREATEKLARALDSYLSYLRSQNKKMKVYHDSPASHVADKTSIQLLQANQSPSSCLSTLDDISHKNPYEHLFVAEYVPSDPREKYRYVQEL